MPNEVDKFSFDYIANLARTRYPAKRLLQTDPMEILFLLIPLAVIVAVVIALFFQWSVKSGQFDDLEGPAHAILMDDDSPQTTLKATQHEPNKPEL